jgi:predicted ATP-dependent serine protease
MPKKSKKAKPKQAPLGKLASEVMPEKTDWVWENRIAKGCVTVIAGDPGVGKSQIAATLAATVILTTNVSTCLMPKIAIVLVAK